jgi:hypothetical protein
MASGGFSSDTGVTGTPTIGRPSTSRTVPVIVPSPEVTVRAGAGNSGESGVSCTRLAHALVAVRASARISQRRSVRFTGRSLVWS